MTSTSLHPKFAIRFEYMKTLQKISSMQQIKASSNKYEYTKANDWSKLGVS